MQHTTALRRQSFGKHQLKFATNIAKITNLEFLTISPTFFNTMLIIGLLSKELI
jgi:hypothetical protein